MKTFIGKPKAFFTALAALFCFLGSAFANTPTLGAINPSGGVSAANSTILFECNYNDSSGWAHLKDCYFLISTSTGLANAAYFYYDQNNNKLYLRNDANSSWLGGYAPGTGTTIENSRVILRCASTTINGSGSALMISWSVTFKPLSAGKTYNTYISAKDDANKIAGLTKKGTYKVVNSSPYLGTINPSSGSGTSQVFTATYMDNDGWQNIQSGYLLINANATYRDCFYAYYDQNTNKFYLRNDGDTAWLGGYAPGSANTIENTYVKLNCASSSISGSGNTLTVNCAVIFKSNFSGAKNTYLYVKDDIGAYMAWTKKGTWTIVAGDTVAPTGSIIINNAAEYTNSVSVTLNLSAEDNAGGSGLSQMQFSNDNAVWSTAENYSNVKQWALAAGDGNKAVYVKFKDAAGNWSNPVSDSIVLDVTAPAEPLINQVVSPVYSASINLSGSKTADAVIVAVSCPTAVIGEVSYPTQTSWSTQLTLGPGQNAITVKCTDAAGNSSAEANTSITYDNTNQSPKFGTINPKTATADAGQSVMVTTTCIDLNGWQDVQYVNLLINSGFYFYGGFVGYYHHNSNLLFMMNDSGSWTGGFIPGSDNIIENSFVKLDCSKTEVTGSGNTMTIKWAITFKPAFTGLKITYFFVIDDAYASNGWEYSGNIFVLRKPVSPPD